MKSQTSKQAKTTKCSQQHTVIGKVISFMALSAEIFIIISCIVGDHFFVQFLGSDTVKKAPTRTQTHPHWK